MAASIDIREATKRFGKVTALNDVSLKIDAGEFIVLLGPSGCGKTTLLRSLAGLETLDDGEIDIAGDVVFSAPRNIFVPPGKRHVGMVFQSYALWPHMTVNDNIGFGLEIQKLPKEEIRQRIDHVLGDLSMSDLGHRYPSELSGGQQQRVAVARLLASKPAVFLMDEPLSNLDARLRMDMRSELKRLHYDTGATTVYVTHDQMEALELATQVVVMNRGKIEQIAPPMEVYSRPATIFVADFIGAPRVNLMPAHIILDGGRVWASIDDFRMPLDWAPEVRNVVLGVRSESVEIFTESESGGVEFSIYAILSNGPEQIIHARRGKTLLVIRESRDLALKMDQPIWLKFDTEAINLYDKETEKLLAPAGRT